MVIIFLLLVFVSAQFYLSKALSGSEGANIVLSQKLAALADQLSLERKTQEGLKSDLSLQSAQILSLTNERNQLSQDLTTQTSQKDNLENQIIDLNKKLNDSSGQIDKANQDAAAAQTVLAQEIASLKQTLDKVASALDVSEKTRADQKVQIDNLEQKLNLALADKVEEMKQYRSEFFGKLRKVLGDRPGIRIEGDRFILQSELLFATGSADLGQDGSEQINQLATTLKQLQQDIPKDVPWVLRVDGHTDKRPITGKISSNWELSTERAINVVRALVADGIPPDHLAAAGFGEFQPLDPADNDAAYAKNRRIELRLDQR
jgi:chemotaxis protein MotB